jgi:SP family general alpha glucoside:H+ symporter-like MFS transporter
VLYFLQQAGFSIRQSFQFNLGHNAIALAGTICAWFTYAITVGPVCYCMVTEIPSTRLRIKTVAMARNAYNILSIAANYLNNPILNPTAWNLRGKGGFVWAPFALVSLIWAYFRLPEPKGRSAGEIDVLFEQRVPARKWSKLQVDEFRSGNLKAKLGNMVEGETQEKQD